MNGLKPSTGNQSENSGCPGAGILTVRRGFWGLAMLFLDLDADYMGMITFCYTLLICAFFWLYVIIQQVHSKTLSHRDPSPRKKAIN